MNKEEIVEFGKHFEEKGIEKVEEKAWVDEAHVLALISSRSDIQSIFNNYTKTKSRADVLLKNIEETQTVKAKFSIEYMKDILKLLIKSDKSIDEVKIRLGNDKAISFEIEDENGKTTIILAPRVEE